MFGADYKSALSDQLRNRSKWGFTGKGAYSVRKFMRDAGRIGDGVRKSYNSWVPKSIRNQVVSMASSKLAAFGGSGLYTGRGSYAANELVDGGTSGGSMIVAGANDETESIRISNREYISDIYGPSSSSFTNNSFYINPGLQSNFPWLSQIASNYEEYEFEKLIFMFKTTVDLGNATTAGQAGTIIMCCDYNASHAPFVNKEVMMQYHGAVSAKTTDDMVCGIECDYSKTDRLASFVRTGPVPTSEDPKTYDLGLFQFALNNIPTVLQNQQLGELWVEYTIRLKIPKLTVSRGFMQQKDIYLVPSGVATTTPSIFGTISNASWQYLKGVQNNIGTSLSYSTASVPATQTDSFGQAYTAGAGKVILTFPASLNGLFAVTFTVRTSTSWTSTTVNIFGLGQISQVFSDYSNSGTTPNWQNVSQSTLMYQRRCYIQLSAATGGVNNQLILDTPSLATVGIITQTYLDVVEMNPAFLTSAVNSSPSFNNYAGVLTLPGY